MKIKLKDPVFIFIFIAIVLLLLFIDRSIWITEPIVKKSVLKKELDGTYILCQRERVTGFDWRVVSGYDSRIQNEYCNISGSNPLEELSLKYDFLIANNTYVFYVEERKEYYSEKMHEMVVEYVVSDWEILYPVRHGTIEGLLKSPNYILESDLEP